MTRWEQAWAEAVLAAFVVERSPGLNVSQGEVDYLSALGRMRERGTAVAALGLRAAIWMAATAPLWFFGRFVMFGTLAGAERTELLSRLLTHHSFAVRELTMLLKLTAAMALLGTASVRARSHYDAPSYVAVVPQLKTLKPEPAAAPLLRVLP